MAIESYTSSTSIYASYCTVALDYLPRSIFPLTLRKQSAPWGHGLVPHRRYELAECCA